jgi:hypothetical protein
MLEGNSRANISNLDIIKNTRQLRLCAPYITREINCHVAIIVEESSY